MSDSEEEDINEQMREAAWNGDRAALERHLNDGADVESGDDNVRRPSAAGLWRPSTSARASLRTPRRRGRTTPPSRRSPRALGRRPAAGSSLAALPLQCG